MATATRTTRVTVPKPPHGFDRTNSGLLAPAQLDNKPSFGSAQEHRQVASNIMHVVGQATPQEHKEGRVWYDKVNEATNKGVKKHSLGSSLQGAGIVSAVSPQMDWENHNIDAFDQMSKLKSNPDHMAALHRSLANVVPSQDKNGQVSMRQKRTPEMLDLITKHYPGLAKAPDSNIHKASRIWDGEATDSVLNPRGAPKTNSFAHAIADPSQTKNPHTGRTLATVDGRAVDIGVNRLQPWAKDRGISSSASKSGKPTRYEHFADAYGTASKVMSAEGPETTPNQAQATSWIAGKRIERTMPGAFSNRGPARHDQRYSA